MMMTLEIINSDYQLPFQQILEMRVLYFWVNLLAFQFLKQM